MSDFWAKLMNRVVPPSATDEVGMVRYVVDNDPPDLMQIQSGKGEVLFRVKDHPRWRQVWPVFTWDDSRVLWVYNRKTAIGRSLENLGRFIAGHNLVVKGAAGQTANLLKLRNSTKTVITGIKFRGN